jgi:hypothetical protein
MTVHDVAPRGRRLGILALRLGSALEVTFALVFGEAHAVISSPFSRSRIGAGVQPIEGGACAVVIHLARRHVPEGGVRRLPTLASSLGLTEYDERLDDTSAAAFQRRIDRQHVARPILERARR